MFHDAKKKYILETTKKGKDIKDETLSKRVLLFVHNS